MHGQQSLIRRSGYAEPDDVQRAVEADLVRHRAKPLSLKKLEEVLGHLNRPDVGPAGVQS